MEEGEGVARGGAGVGAAAVDDPVVPAEGAARQLIPPVLSLFTRFRPYLGHFPPVFSRFKSLTRLWCDACRQWVDCSCTSRGCCSGADQNKSGDALQPLNLDAQLQANFAFDSLYTAKGMRSLTMNRVPGRGDGTNCESEALPLSIRSLLE